VTGSLHCDRVYDAGVAAGGATVSP